jgi:hypothetical protein
MTDTSKIPDGSYCYSVIGHGKNDRIKINPCPYWSRRHDKPNQVSGYCSYLGVGDWELPGGLLWDQVKECGVKDE